MLPFIFESSRSFGESSHSSACVKAAATASSITHASSQLVATSTSFSFMQPLTEILSGSRAPKPSVAIHYM
jgi:hypothetical protein